MRRPLRLAIVSLSGAAIGFGASRCGTQTQLIVEVSTDMELTECNRRLDTGIFVGKTSAETNDKNGPVVSKHGCERANFIGSAVFLPAGADDQSFAIKIITAVDATVSECITGVKNTCIVEYRAVRYEPGAIVRVKVSMDQQCIGRDCLPTQTCKGGACVACSDCVDPGGVDAGPPKDTGADVTEIFDAGPCPLTKADGGALCTSCTGPGLKTCIIDCASTACIGDLTCPPQHDCVVKCTGDGKFCKDKVIDCTAASSCHVTCESSKFDSDLCQNTAIRCGTGSCRIECKGPHKVCHDLAIEGSASSSFCLSCVGDAGVCVNTKTTCTVPANQASCQRNCSACEDGVKCDPCTDFLGDCR